MCAVRVVKAVSIFGCFYFKTKMFFFFGEAGFRSHVCQQKRFETDVDSQTRYPKKSSFKDEELSLQAVDKT